MIVALIVAMDEAGGIGYRGGLPWRLRTDLQRFKERTMGHHLIVGRRTWEAIGRPLPGRKMVVVSRTLSAIEGVRVVASLEEALRVAESAGEVEAFIGGGAQLYAAALPQAQRIYLTRVHARLAADVFFPPLDWTKWRCVAREEYPAGPGDEHPFSIETWQLP